MIVYILMLIISLFFTYLFSKTNNRVRKIIYIIFVILPFTIVSAIRYDVGTDYFFRYVPNYIESVNGGNVESLEILFRSLIKFCILISKDYSILFIVTSIIINTLIIGSIFKFSKNVIISIIIYFGGSFFFESMNLVRQFIAMSIIFCSYRLLFNKKRIVWWILCVITAILFHTMSIVFIISILLDKKVINYKVLIALLIIIIAFGRPIIDFSIGTTANSTSPNISKYEHYLKEEGDLPLSNIIVEVGIYIYLYLMHENALNNGKKPDKEWVFLLNMQTLTILFTVMNIHLELFFRVALLFSVFQIISIPYFYNLNKDCEWRLFNFKTKNKINQNIMKIAKKWNLIFCVCLIVLLNSRMIFSNIIKGADEILPYQTIFSREEK